MISGILSLFWLLIVPVLFGFFVSVQWLKQPSQSIASLFVIGTISVWAVLYPVMMLFYVFKFSLNALIMTWVAYTCILIIWGIARNWNLLLKILQQTIVQMKNLPWTVYLVIFLILLQAFGLFWLSFEDADDAFYVVTASTAVETNTIFQYDVYTGYQYTAPMARYVLSPFPIFYAMIAKLSLLHPTILAHTVLPLFYIPLAYVLIFLIIYPLFKNNLRKTANFLLIFNLVTLFGGTTRYTNSIYLLGRAWQGKSVLANLILPALFYFGFIYYRNKYDQPDLNKNSNHWMMVIFTVLAGCLISSMSVAMLPAILLVLSTIYVFKHKTIRPLLDLVIFIIPCVILGITYLLIE